MTAKALRFAYWVLVVGGVGLLDHWFAPSIAGILAWELILAYERHQKLVRHVRMNGVALLDIAAAVGVNTTVVDP